MSKDSVPLPFDPQNSSSNFSLFHPQRRIRPNRSIPQLSKIRQSLLLIYDLNQFENAGTPNELQDQITRKNIPHLGFATCILEKGLVISARHIFNNNNAQNFIFFHENTKQFYRFGLLEDGALNDILPEHMKDYVVGALLAFNSKGKSSLPPYLPLNFETPPGGKAYLPSLNGMQDAIIPSGTSQQLTISLNFKSQQGDCGLPYLDEAGSVFAIHAKRSNSPLFNYERTGILISQINCCSKIFKETQDCHKDYSFDSYTTILQGLPETEESGKKRDEALGGTPSISGWGKAVRAVLLRYFANKQAQLEVKEKLFSQILKKNRRKCSAYFNNLTQITSFPITYQQLGSVYQNKIELLGLSEALIKLKSLQNYWKILVPRSESEKPTWNQLIEKIKIVKTNKSGKEIESEIWSINMGHIVPAVAFWSEGSQPYLNEFTDVLQNDNQRRQHLFTTYKVPGITTWISEGKAEGSYIFKFMQDPHNYEFDYWAINNKKSHEEYEKNLKFLAPTGYRWGKEPFGKKGRLKNVLIPTSKLPPAQVGPKLKYRNFSAAPKGITVKYDGKFVELRHLQWPVFTEEIKYRSLFTSYVKNHLNVEFELRIQDFQKLEEEKQKALKNKIPSRALKKYTRSDLNQSDAYYFFKYPKNTNIKKDKYFRVIKNGDTIINDVIKLLS